MDQAIAIRELRDIGLDTPGSDESFERFARLVHRQLKVPTAFVSLILETEQVIPGAQGLPDRIQRKRTIPLTHSLCTHVANTAEPLIVGDTRLDPRLRDSPAAVDLGVISYAGFPIFDAKGRAVGSLCAIDHDPRTWTEAELATLADLASACSSELRLRLAGDRARRLQHISVQATRRSRLLLGLSESFANATSVADVVECLAGVGQTINARWVGLALLDSGGRTMTYTTMHHMEPRIAPAFRRVNLNDDRPSAVAARTQTPLFYRSVDELIAAFPTIASAIDTDVGARAFLPVLQGSKLLGVMMLAWEIDREFSAEAVKTEIAIASYLAHALDRVALLEERNRTAMTLQNAMLSPLPDVRHLELGSVYTPAAATDQVGGDWYDAVALDDETCVVMIGDVTGHDMQAAAQMGQLRSMLRTFTWSRDDSPATLLGLLDRANIGLGLDAAATAVVARIERRVDESGDVVHTLTWSNAGHPPPFVLRADGSVHRCDSEPDMMLGIVPTTDRHDHVADLAPGDTLVLYTDGLIELRGTRLPDRLVALGEALESVGGTTTQALPDALVRRLVLGGGGRDDVAVLAVRVRHAPENTHPVSARLDVPSRTSAIGRARRWGDDILESADVSAERRRTAMLLTSELVTNAIQHAAPPVSVEVSVADARVRVEVTDGSPELPRVLSPEPHETGGRGMQFLERRAERWGVVEHGSSTGGPRKTIWFELDLDGVAPSSH